MKTIIYGNIFNFDSTRISYEALVVNEEGRIIYLGSKKIAQIFIKPEDKILDYGKHYVYPGFMDAHTHGVIAATELKFSLDISKGKSFNDYATILKKHISENPNKRMYLGHGWQQFETPTKEFLDTVSKDKPIILTSMDCHSRWLNSKALELLKLTPEIIKQYGPDKIHVDKDGNPTGWIGEAAIQIVDAICELNKDELKEGLLAWQDFAFANGLTGVVDAAVDKSPIAIQAYSELVKEGKWKLRTYGYGLYKPLVDKDPNKAIEQLIQDKKKYNCEYFKIVGLKVFIDGVAEAHTASMLKPYNDTPDYTGVNYFEDCPDKLANIVYAANKQNIPVHFHTIGDKAVKTALDAIETAAVKKGSLTWGNALAHLQFVQKSDIERLADLQATAVVAPLWMPIFQPIFNNELKWLGEKRAYEEYPLKSFEKAGALLCFHTDFPISPRINTAEQFYAAARRATTAKPISSAKNTTECISIPRALIANSLNVAFMVEDDLNVGSFGIGKAANCSVFDINFLECDPEKTKNCHLIATIVDGKEVYKK